MLSSVPWTQECSLNVDLLCAFNIFLVNGFSFSLEKKMVSFTTISCYIILNAYRYHLTLPESVSGH